ncbi:MAG: sulfatase-like hydrolase/transferase [Flammeovirgaceae bacterium]|nr:sulfatase-like hydrolase/transferase [Flammeovirgaceae bacterium]
MRERLKLMGWMGLYWLCFFVAARTAFLLYNHELATKLNVPEIFKIFFNGLKMDLSMTGYYLALAGLIFTVSSVVQSKWNGYVLNTITFIYLLFCSIIITVDMELYRHWNFRMNTTPLFYIGSEAAGSVSPQVIGRLVVILILFFGVSSFIYYRFIVNRVVELPKPSEKKSALVLFLTAALMFIPIRGSFTVAPMNTGFVYFHPTNPFANHSGINVIWNFLNSVRKGKNIQYPENFFDRTESEKLFNSLYPKQDSTFRIIDGKPNILLIILESFTSDVIEPLGGRPTIAPTLNKLCREAILFDNFFSSGDRTDKGIVSILSGYPAQPQTSIIKFPAKTQHLPYLPLELLNQGYRTSFTYGGDVDFANFRSYLTQAGFEHITTIDDFDDEINISKWGVHDHFVFERAKHECDTATNPFFKVILTLSSHEPFDVPDHKFFKGSDDESLFLNSCHYTDSSLGVFIESAKNTDWWKNTLVVITADHGHRLPGHKELKDDRRFRVPLLLAGGVIKKDSVIHTYANHTDIAATLLSQINTSAKDFRFSKNILGSPVVSFSAYYFNDGYGFMLPGKKIVYDNPGQQFLTEENADDDDIKLSKAYQQILYSDYNSKE